MFNTCHLLETFILTIIKFLEASQYVGILSGFYLGMMDMIHMESVFEINLLFCATLGCIHLETVRPGIFLSTPLTYSYDNCLKKRAHMSEKHAPGRGNVRTGRRVHPQYRTLGICWLSCFKIFNTCHLLEANMYT